MEISLAKIIKIELFRSFSFTEHRDSGQSFGLSLEIKTNVGSIFKNANLFYFICGRLQGLRLEEHQ